MTGSLSEHHALLIVENCPLPLVVTDRQGRVVSYNRAFERLVGTEQACELQGQSPADLGAHPARALLGTNGPLSWTGRDAEQRHFEVQTVELSGPHFLQARLFVDITRQVQLEQARDTLHEELKQHILTDPGTGLLNRRGITLALEPQVARSRRYSSPIAVIVMEVRCQGDADATRKQVALLLKDQLRWADLIGYTETHEFVLILPETTAAAALHLADKLDRRLQDSVEPAPDYQPFDICYGVTEWRRSDNASSLLRRAGMALCQARSEQHRHSLAL